MLRATLLYLSEQKQVNAFVRRNRLARKGASRFVAGETLDEAATAVRALNAKRISASLDLLGESVTNADEARAAASAIVGIFDRIAADKLDCNVSVKLTQLGFDLGDDLVRENVRRILDRAKQLGIFLRIDMEGSVHTQRTLDLFERELFPAYGRDIVGIVLQSYLYRTAADVDRLIAAGARVRLCKGAYKEPPAIAFPAKADVDRSFADLSEKLIERGPYPGIATHDEALIAHTKRFVQSKGIPRDRFEFQMLNGVRRDLQERLVGEGYRLRVYVPYGTQWYPYFMRRLAERPANIAFIVGNVLREGVRG
jgi:proline dehydrogenase